MNHCASRPAIIVAASFVATIIAFACTPAQRQIAHDVSGAGCDAVEAITSDGTVEKVCAIADDIQTILAAVATSRADAGADSGARLAVRCVVIPTTTVCATNAERLAGIRAVKAQLGPR
jgi:hypothetical protein